MNIIREKGNINQNVGRILFRSTVQDHYSLYTFKFSALFIGPIDRGVIHQQWHYTTDQVVLLCMYFPCHHIWSVFCNIFILVFSSKFSRFFSSGLVLPKQVSSSQLSTIRAYQAPFLAVVESEQKKNRILSFLQKYQYANYVISKMCIERIPASNTEQRRVLSISLIFDIPNTKNIPKTDDGRETFSFSSQILLCWQLLLRCVFWNAAVQHIHKPYKARGGQFYGFIRGAVFYLHGLKIHGA